MSKFIQKHLNLLKKNNIIYPEIELRALLKYSLLIKKDIFLSNFRVDLINLKKFQSAFKRRILKEPFSKICNQKEFWSLDFYVNSDVLDPRPESEFLIEGINKYFNDLNKKIRIFDLGTGSGCLAITLAKLYTKAKIDASDISKEAIKIAYYNSIKHKVEGKIKFINCDWINNVNKYDIVVSNPPYLSYEQYNNCGDNIKNFEPKISLLAGQDGLEAYRKISSFSNFILSDNSYLFIEIGINQGDDVINIFNKYNLKTVKIIKDYQSIDRVLVIKKRLN